MPRRDSGLTAPALTPPSTDRLRGTGWAILAAVEILLAGAVVIFDVFIPTLSVVTTRSAYQG